MVGGRLALWICCCHQLILLRPAAPRAAPDADGKNRARSTCFVHAECRSGEFCGLETLDSFEGWAMTAGVCRPCAQCRCHADSATGFCPSDRCAGTPSHQVRSFEGTFFSATSVPRLGGDICVSSFTVRASWFRMVAFLVDKAVYDSAYPALPPYTLSSSAAPALCDYPDAPGGREGRVDQLPVTRGDMAARLNLTYIDGLPIGTSRVVTLFDNCPRGFSAHFEPIRFIKSAFDVKVGHDTPFYSYDAASADNPYASLHTSGYMRKDSGASTGALQVLLDGPASEYGGLLGTYSGFFEFGTTRRGRHDLGEQKALLCNITFQFAPGLAGLVSWDQHTWGCRLRIPPPAITDRQQNAENEIVQTKKNGKARENGSQTSITVGSRRDIHTCLPGSHLIIETTEEGRAALDAANDVIGDNYLRECLHALKYPYCCDQCAAGKYQHLADRPKCLSCPAGLTSKMRGGEGRTDYGESRGGASSLSDCCLTSSGIGLYNDHVQTTFNEFGVNNEIHAIGAKYYWPNGFQSDQFISMVPNVTSEVEAFQGDLGIPGPFCGDIQMVIQPMIGDQVSVASVIELDFDCPNCFFDVGPQGTVNISMYLVSSETIRPPELLQLFTAPPEVSRPRTDETFNSRELKETSRTVLDFTLDNNLPVIEFHGNTSNTPLSRHYSKYKQCVTSFMSPSPGTADCPAMEKLLISSQLHIASVLTSFAEKAQQMEFACEYENPVADGQVPPHPWKGTNPPKCEKEYQSRVILINNATVNNYTLHRRDDENVIKASNAVSPLTIGVRVSAKVTPGHKGFNFGYKFVEASRACRAGTSSYNGALPCSSCPAGKFTPVDGHTGDCFDCPRGTYSDNVGSIKCSVCPMGTSTSEDKATSRESCISFCRAGQFSKTGLEPCQVCPKDTTQSKVGATFCDKCSAGKITLGAGTGFTNVGPWICYRSGDLVLDIDRARVDGRSLYFYVSWKLPESGLNVLDIVAIFKGDPFQSIRQLDWMYPSTSTTTCDVFMNDNNCRQAGTAVVPHGSTVFKIDSAGPGLYGVVYFSESRRLRILGTTLLCNATASYPEGIFCPPDQGGWEVTTGLYVCNKGQYSSNGLGPCSTCPPGTISAEIAGTKCTPCQQGFYSNRGTQDVAGSVVGDRCLRCPAGFSTLEVSSTFADCKSCDNSDLVQAQPVPFCASAGGGAAETTAEVDLSSTTTPSPAPKTLDLCGSGLLRNTEECDDGNTNGGDGCSPTCEIEPFFKCLRVDLDTHLRCYLACGDGKIDTNAKNSEQCDDGNTVNGDGCTSLCDVETGWRCFGKPDDISQCETLPTCGASISQREKGVVPRREWEKNEACDDGNGLSGDGCSSECTIEANYVCSNYSALEPDSCCATVSLCGNGNLDLCEACDDSNLVNNDGCTDQCRFEDMNKCRDGCSGPLCVTQDHCPELLIGDRVQGWSSWQELNCSDATCRVKGIHVLSWLGVDDHVYYSGVRWQPPRLTFNVPESGSNVASYSTGLLLNDIQGPNEFSSVNLLTTTQASNSGIRGSSINFAFKGILGRGQMPSQFACHHCSSSIILSWPVGTISEPSGMMPSDFNCNWLIDAAAPIQGSAEYNARGIEVIIHEIDFEHDDEFLSVGHTKSGYPSYNKRFFRNSLMPVILHMHPVVRVGFWGKSHLFNRTSPWIAPSGKMRFKITYKTLLIGIDGEQCSKNCEYDPDCMLQNSCFAKASPLTLERDFVEFRRSSLSDEAVSVTEKDTVTQSHARHRNTLALRASETDREQLTMTLDAIGGFDGEMPCAFGQNQRQLMTVVGRSRISWQGAAGAWDGSCFILPSCSSVQDAPCVPDNDYFSNENVCSIRIEISDRTIREYRYGCQGNEDMVGSASGVISHLQSTPVKIDPPGIVYRPFELTWTQSSLSDRSVGVQIEGALTFGESPEFDSRANSGMQIVLGDVLNSRGLAAPLYVDPSSVRFGARVGGCRRFDLSKRGDPLHVRSVKVVAVEDDQKNLRMYRTCNESLRELQQLAASSESCRTVLDVFLFRDTEAPLLHVDREICSSSCLTAAQIALRSSSEICSKMWKSSLYPGRYAKEIFKKTVITSTAHFWSKMACQINAYGKQCTRTIRDYSELFATCPLFMPVSNSSRHSIGQPQLSAPFDVHNRTLNPLCPGSCAAALLKYQSQDGCCAASVAQGSTVWAKLLSKEGAQMGKIDLGNTSDPWTPLGKGSASRIYDSGYDCATADQIYPQCLMKSTAYCNRPSWPPACCSFSCKNKGTKAFGDCYCACPYGLAGAACDERSIHIRVEMMFDQETKMTFHAGKQAWLQDAFEKLTEVDGVKGKVEWDSIKEFPEGGQLRRRLQATTSKSVLVAIRILFSSTTTSTRLRKMLAIGLLDNTVARKIEQSSNGAWTPVLVGGSMPPVVFSLDGLEICDDIEIKCFINGGIDPRGSVQSASTPSAATEPKINNKRSIIIAGAVVGGVAGALLAALIIRACYVKRELISKQLKSASIPRSKAAHKRRYGIREATELFAAFEQDGKGDMFLEPEITNSHQPRIQLKLGRTTEDSAYAREEAVAKGNSGSRNKGQVKTPYFVTAALTFQTNDYVPNVGSTPTLTDDKPSWTNMHSETSLGAVILGTPRELAKREGDNPVKISKERETSSLADPPEAINHPEHRAAGFSTKMHNKALVDISLKQESVLKRLNHVQQYKQNLFGGVSVSDLTAANRSKALSAVVGASQSDQTSKQGQVPDAEIVGVVSARSPQSVPFARLARFGIASEHSSSVLGTMSSGSVMHPAQPSQPKRNVFDAVASATPQLTPGDKPGSKPARPNVGDWMKT